MMNNSRAVGTSKYSSELKAQAYEMICGRGIPAQHAADELGIPRRTVQHWAEGWRQLAAEESDSFIMDQNHRIIRLAGNLMLDGLQYIAYKAEEEPEVLLKNGQLLNMYRGTAQDKVHAGRGHGGNTTNVIVITKGSPDIEVSKDYIDAEP